MIHGLTIKSRRKEDWVKKMDQQKTKEMKSSIWSVREMCTIGMMTALICVMAPFSVPIPISPVPISLTNLALYFAIYVLGGKRTTICCVLYLLIGLAGVPVFSNFTGGAGKLLGPTGGYLIGFLFMVILGGYIVDRWNNKILICVLGLIAGTGLCYMFGTVWLAVQLDKSFGDALLIGVIPFLPGDFVKIVIASLIGPRVRKLIKKAGYIS